MVEVRGFQSTDADAVARIDTGSEVDSIAVVSAQGRSFTWEAVALAEPRQKVHDIGAYVRDDADRWSAAYVAVHDSGLVGFAAAQLENWNRRVVLSHMYVDRSARGLGVGRNLLTELIAGIGSNMRHIWLETQDTNVPAIRAYERLGFRIVGLDTSLYGDAADSEIAVFMCRPLEGDERSLTTPVTW